MDKEGPNGLRIREEQVLVGDETGCMYIRARNGKRPLGVPVHLCTFAVRVLASIDLNPLTRETNPCSIVLFRFSSLRVTG